MTDEIYKGWAGLNTRNYKKLKGLAKENLRDNMTNLELVLNMLAEVTTTEIAQNEQPFGMPAHMDVVRRGAAVAGNARREIESKTGKPAVTGRNAGKLKKIENKY